MKDSKRAKERARRKIAKADAMSKPHARSKYGQKKAEQRNGTYRPTSPFYLPSSMREVK